MDSKGRLSSREIVAKLILSVLRTDYTYQ